MICLNMIVKNEEEDLPRCLKSVKPYIDYYLISDTGSTDNTVEVIRKCLEGVPGEVLRHKWKDFGHNRELILQEAYKNPDIDYCLFIDADEELFVNNGAFDNPADAYYIEKHISDIKCIIPSVINIKSTEWHWSGVVHNDLSGKPKNTVFVDGYIEAYPGKGGKSSGLSSLKEKALRDARLIEKELKKTPNDARYQFFLAQSYYAAGKLRKARNNYIKRMKMGGDRENVYWSMLLAALLEGKLEEDFPISKFLLAYNYRPTRKEALCEVANYCNQHGLYPLGYMVAKMGYDIPKTKDVMFVVMSVEDWRMADELAVSAFGTKRYKESRDLCDELLTSGKLPKGEVKRVKRNRRLANAKSK